MWVALLRREIYDRRSVSSVTRFPLSDWVRLEQNARAATLELPPGVVEELTKASEPLKLKLGPNLDQYQSESRFR